jgi:hypothetical protein
MVVMTHEDVIGTHDLMEALPMMLEHDENSYLHRIDGRYGLDTYKCTHSMHP